MSLTCWAKPLMIPGPGAAWSKKRGLLRQEFLFQVLWEGERVSFPSPGRGLEEDDIESGVGLCGQSVKPSYPLKQALKRKSHCPFLGPM